MKHFTKSQKSQLRLHPNYPQFIISLILGIVWILIIPTMFWFGDSIVLSIVLTLFFCFYQLVFGVHYYKIFPLRITITREGVTAENMRTKEIITSQWSDFYAIYLLHNAKGNAYVLMSKQPLDFSEQNALRLRFCPWGNLVLSVDGNMCVYTYWGQWEEIKNFIPDHTLVFEQHDFPCVS